MKKTNLQFQATKIEIYDLIEKISYKLNADILAVKMFPEFKVKILDKNSIKENYSSIEEFDTIFLSLNKYIDIPNSYREIDTIDKLIINIGKETHCYIKESSIGGIFNNEDTYMTFIKEINSLKRRLLKGAWIENTVTKDKAFYKNYYYTLNAKKMYEKGIKIYPLGNNITVCYLTDKI